MPLAAHLERAALRHRPDRVSSLGFLVASAGVTYVLGLAATVWGTLGGTGPYPGLVVLAVALALHGHAQYLAATRLLHAALADPDEVRDQRDAVRRPRAGRTRRTRRAAHAAASKTRAA